MKIIQVIPLLDLAGAETMCENLTNGLLKLGHEVTVVSLYNYQSPITERMQGNGINIVYLNKRNGIDVSTIFKLIKVFKEYEPDVVHSHLYAGKYAHIAASLCRIPGKVYTIHNIATKEAGRLNRLFNRFLFKHCNVIPVALSGEIQKSVMIEYGMGSVFTPVVFNGVPMEKCHKKKDYAGNKKLLHVGRFATAKNHEVLVKSIANLVESGHEVQLDLYGQGELEESTKDLVKKLHMENNIKFCGLTDDIYSIMEQCDIFVLPSIYEGMPMTLIEAMGTGMPILASNVGGIPDMIENEKSGLLCEPTVDGVVRGLERLIESEEDRKRYGENAIISSEKFSADKMAKDYYKIYVKACRGRK